MTPEPGEPFEAAVRAERVRQVLDLGFTPEHDAEQGIGHLLEGAFHYAGRGDRVKCGALILAASQLADATLDAGGVLDRDQARDVLFDYQDGTKDTTEALDALSACVRPAALDRDALGRMLGQLRSDEVHGGVPWTDQEWADLVLALVRPAAGVTLSPEETALAQKVIEHSLDLQWEDEDEWKRAEALAARLEATS